MHTRGISLLVAVLLLTGAAAVGAQPVVATPTGVWGGVITGREMATASGLEEQYVRLVVNDDGTWTMTTATWRASGRITSQSRGFVLEGNFTTSKPEERLGPALYYLSQWGNQALVGNASARYKGLHITSGITLKKVQ